MKANTVNNPVAMLNQKKIALAVAIVIAGSTSSISTWAQDKAESKVPAATVAATQENDLLTLYRQAAFSDPVFNSAKYNYIAGKEKLWQGFSVLTPQLKFP